MRRALAVLLLTACAHAAPATSTTTSEPTTALPPRPRVPAEIAVPDNAPLVLAAPTKGVQIYECVTSDGGGAIWKLHAPRADLFDAHGVRIATHFGGVDKDLPAGPYWEANDGSRVHGGPPVRVPNPGSIALLKIEAVDNTGTGVFAKVAFLQRLATTGGVEPEGACTLGEKREVPYTATYYFYGKPTP